jgi:IclR family acetate operon transcriptional repressor
VSQSKESVARLREVALSRLRWVVDELGETANAMVLAGSEVRFVATVECDHVLRVGDRTGRTLPAHLASGGKV